MSQQTPCAQNPEMHSVASAQVLPRPLRPHDPLVHTAGGAQSPSPVQEALQTPAPHSNGKHELAPGVTQAPWPSQVEPGVNVVVFAGQLEPAQAVPRAYFWHAPAAHLPFVAQLAGPMSTQMSAGSGVSFGTFVQVPSAPVSAHEVQAPEHAVSQQTPCAQKDVWHSVAFEHEAPRIFLPHELTLHTLGVTQLPLIVHALKQVLPLQT